MLVAPGLLKRRSLPIFYGIRMEEHTHESNLPYINGNVVRKWVFESDGLDMLVAPGLLKRRSLPTELKRA